MEAKGLIFPGQSDPKISRPSLAIGNADRGRSNINMWVGDIPKTGCRSVVLGDALLVHSICRLVVDPAVRSFTVDWSTVKKAAEDDGLKGDGMILVEPVAGPKLWHRVYSGNASKPLEASTSGLSIEVFTIQDLGDWQIRFDNLATLIQMANSVRRFSCTSLYLEMMERLDLTKMATFEELLGVHPGDRGLALGVVARMILDRVAFIELDSQLFGMETVIQAAPGGKSQHGVPESIVVRASSTAQTRPATAKQASRGRPRRLAKNYTSIDGWPAPDISTIKDKEKAEAYQHRRDAVELYIAEAAPATILKLTGLSIDQARYFFSRCVTTSENGSIFGLYGLLDNFRIKAYERTATTSGIEQNQSAGYAGALEQALARYKDAANWLNEAILEEALGEGQRYSNLQLADKFQEKLNAAGAGKDEWPFCTTDGGVEAIRRYRHKLIGPGKPVTGTESTRLASQVGMGHEVVIKSIRPLSYLQLDYQTVGAHAILKLVNKYGRPVKVPLKRWSIGYAGYEYPSAVAGVGTCYEREPSTDTALETISSLLNPEDDVLYQGRLDQTQGGKFLGRHFVKALEWTGWTVLRLDNAKANQSRDMVHNTIDAIGCFVCFGQPYRWWSRNVIEGLIHRINAGGLARVPSTAGTGPADPRKKKNPAAVAMRTEFDRDAVEARIFGAIGDYNASPAGNLQGSSPVEAAASYVQTGNDGFFLRPLPKQTQASANLLYHCLETTVQGHPRGGGVYLKIKGIQFSSEAFASSRQFLHKKVLVFILRRDARHGKVFAPDTGEPLGEIKMKGARARAPLSWKDLELLQRESSGSRKRRGAKAQEEPTGNSQPNSKPSRSVSTEASQARLDAHAILRAERTAALANHAGAECDSPEPASPPPARQLPEQQQAAAVRESFDDPWGIASIPQTAGVHHG